MTKKSENTKLETSKRYLRIIGMINIGLAIINIIVAIVWLIVKIPIDQLQMGDVDKLHNELNMTDDAIRGIAVGGIIVAGLISVLIGWLIYRAGKNAKKTTAALVFIVLGCISAAAAVFTDKYDNIVQTLSNMLHLAVYVLAFLAVMKIRQSNDD